MKFINEKKYQISKQQKIIYIFAGRVCFVICSENGYDVFKFNFQTKLSFKTRYSWSSPGLKDSFLNWFKGGCSVLYVPLLLEIIKSILCKWKKNHLLQAGDVLLGKSHYIKLNTKFKHLLLSCFVTWFI